MKKIILLSLLLISTPLYAAQKLTILLDWFMNPSHAPLFVAEQEGFFKQQGLDVNLIGPADPTDPPKLVAAGKADIAIDYEPQFIEQIDQGLPLITVGTLIDQPLNCLTVLKSSGITSIAQLKNKKIGGSLGSLENALLKVELAHHGVSINDVQFINVHYDLTQSLLSGKVDAVTGMMRTYEVIQLELAGHPATPFYPEENGVPTYSELIFVINKNKINDPRIPKFIKAVQQGEDYLQKHPDEMWQAFRKAHPESNDELNHRAWNASLPYFAKNIANYNQNDWTHFVNFMHQVGLIKNPQPIDQYIRGI